MQPSGSAPGNGDARSSGGPPRCPLGPLQPGADQTGTRWGRHEDEMEARVYYDIDEAAQIVRALRVGKQIVRALRVGKQIRNHVFIRGVETDMREQP
jgi:hypothetical protein